jgi:hypothetical protein
MFPDTLPKNAQNALAVLGKSDVLSAAYMAGGTALALQIGQMFAYYDQKYGVWDENKMMIIKSLQSRFFADNFSFQIFSFFNEIIPPERFG